MKDAVPNFEVFPGVSPNMSLTRLIRAGALPPSNEAVMTQELRQQQNRTRSQQHMLSSIHAALDALAGMDLPIEDDNGSSTTTRSPSSRPNEEGPSPSSAQ